MLFRWGILLLLLTSLKVQAERLVITVAAPDIPPFVYQDASGQIKGSLVTQLQQAEQQSNLSFRFYVIPWARALKSVSDDKIDAIMPTLKTPERLLFLHYPQQALQMFSGDALLQRSDVEPKITSLPQLPRQATVAKMRATALGQDTDELIRRNEIRVIEAVDVSAAIDMLVKRRVDYVIADKKISAELIARLALQAKIFSVALPTKAEQTPSYLAFSKKFARQHDINAIMQQIMASMASTVENEN